MQPPPETIERWCSDLIGACDLQRKLRPPAPPATWEERPVARRLPGPGRPPELAVTGRRPRSLGDTSLERRDVRSRLIHTFLHHELQAAELFAWAVLAFPEAPRAFRGGLVRLCLEELGHLALYERHLARLGHAVGDFPVRDWFWERVASCEDAAAFVALQGLGLEGANLEHSARFAAKFRSAGDEEGAQLLERVERDEVEHVRFAREWFERFTSAPLEYGRWRDALPAPLTPAVLQGRPLNRDARRRAGLDDAFLDRLAAEPPTTLGGAESRR